MNYMKSTLDMSTSNYQNKIQTNFIIKIRFLDVLMGHAWTQ